MDSYPCSKFFSLLYWGLFGDELFYLVVQLHFGYMIPQEKLMVSALLMNILMCAARKHIAILLRDNIAAT